MSVNRVFLLGNLGKDPEVRHTQGGTTVANLRIATTERRPDGNGGWQDQTEWHSVVVFGKQADNVKKFLTKGRQVFVEGSLRTRQWQDQQGQKRFSTEVVALRVEFIGGRTSQGPSDEMGATVPPGDEGMPADFGGGPDDDIPF
jgi:single-strand DNA-binding protein